MEKGGREMEWSNEELVEKIKQGESNYLVTLWGQIERYVYLKAVDRLNYTSKKYMLEDLQQEGYLAMLDAIKYYNPDKGSKFITILTLCLKNRFNDVLDLRTKRGKYDPLQNALSLDEIISEGGESTSTMTRGDLLPDNNAIEPFLSVEDKDYQESLKPFLQGILRRRNNSAGAKIVEYIWKNDFQVSINVQNKKPPKTSVSVQKKWYKDDGSLMTENLPESVQVELYRSTTKPGGGSSGGSQGGTTASKVPVNFTSQYFDNPWGQAGGYNMDVGYLEEGDYKYTSEQTQWFADEIPLHML